MKMVNFVHYDPKHKVYGDGVQYFCDDQGRDFYDSRDLFTKKYVVLFDQYGMVRSVAKATDVTTTYPLGLSIVDINSLPKGFSLTEGSWKFDGKKVVKSEIDLAVGTPKRKKILMSTLNKGISDLAMLVEIGEATEKEVEKHTELRKLYVKLMRVPDDTPPGEVDWSAFTAA